MHMMVSSEPTATKCADPGSQGVQSPLSGLYGIVLVTNREELQGDVSSSLMLTGTPIAIILQRSYCAICKPLLILKDPEW